MNGFLKRGLLDLPSKLLLFLRSDHIKKAGVRIGADLKKLYGDCGFESGRHKAFAGAINLGSLAKEHGIVPRANVSLADLTMKTLGRDYDYLEKVLPPPLLSLILTHHVPHLCPKSQ